ncbi:hypothetical protein HU200_010996 [Digitaria exilis]|uniref:RABX5 catalytic core helical domain-containing protein n=1 Tax=Digitaria exilis TaxID=1010633 RepID=A0A835FH91_9POAL|nr:hypothetical protein HU200_066385 [Digitaria exilis]KAF8757472.1 hypothetical protein HU200_010996 [Digitaria exilis]CAB3497511.1 unnamed protein product [Digitaria exilis]
MDSIVVDEIADGRADPPILTSPCSNPAARQHVNCLVRQTGRRARGGHHEANEGGVAMDSPTSAAARPDFYDFLDRMRRPAAADFFRSIKRSVAPFPVPYSGEVPPPKNRDLIVERGSRAMDLSNQGLVLPGSFLVSFSFHEPNAEEDGSKVQAFLTEMESAIRDHPLWANATNQEIDYALEGSSIGGSTRTVPENRTLAEFGWSSVNIDWMGPTLRKKKAFLFRFCQMAQQDQGSSSTLQDATTDMEISEKIAASPGYT